MKIGMIFESEDPWEIGFAHAKEYAKAFGNLDIPTGYVCSEGYNLGIWITNQRRNHNTPIQYRYLTTEQSKRLEEIGIVWNPTKQRWLDGFRHACEYAKLLNGNKWLTNYVSPDEYQTEQWLHAQKRRSMKNQLEADKVVMLAEIGFVFGN